MNPLPGPAQAVSTWARVTPHRVGVEDSRRRLTFREWHCRACRLANALRGLGLKPGDRFAVLAYNCLEWMEIYVAAARAGLVAVPVNFRLAAPEIAYVISDSGARVLIAQLAFLDTVRTVREQPAAPSFTMVLIDGEPDAPGDRSYARLVEEAGEEVSNDAAGADTPWVLMYTSGTTGRPKGALRAVGTCAPIALVTALDMGFTRDDSALLVMPMCHANSLFFAFSFVYLGARCVIHDRASFDPEYLLATLSSKAITFTSLVPTHYVMLQELPAAVKRRYPCRDVSRLMISSAPARRETKIAVMEQFPNSRLFELYGSSEAGWVTLLRPGEQLTHLGSIGREWTATGPVRILDAEGHDVPDGEIGELYSRTPYAFSGYWNLPDKTAEAFRGDWCTVGDMARRDDEGFYHLVDRKSNMIISGGENVYPSEVEAVIAAHPGVSDVAVIGVDDPRWGETVRAVVIRKTGDPVDESALIAWCRERMAGYKRPRSVVFVTDADMPRTTTGKIQHRLVKARWGHVQEAAGEA